jgi:hypothetical protein
MPLTHDQSKKLRDQLMAQLEAALATAEALGSGASMEAYLIEQALDNLRASTWPGNLDVPLGRLPPDRRRR